MDQRLICHRHDGNTQVTLGCRMLHYTGHGSPSCLIFENENGEANLLVRTTHSLPRPLERPPRILSYLLASAL